MSISFTRGVTACTSTQAHTDDKKFHGKSECDNFAGQERTDDDEDGDDGGNDNYDDNDDGGNLKYFS